MMVLAVANGMFRSSVWLSQSSGFTARMVKYMANSAEKNISSDESQTIVPTLTMFGRLTPTWAGVVSTAAVAVATGGIVSVLTPGITPGGAHGRDASLRPCRSVRSAH